MRKPYKLNKDNFSPELCLLLGLIGYENNKIRLDLIVTQHAFNWETFVELIKHHRVYPYINQIINIYKFDFIPDDILLRVKQMCTQNTFQMFHLYAEQLNICKVFHENSIQVIMLKGPVMAEMLFGDISNRTSKDLDVLVAPQDVAKAENLLKELGYESEYTSVLHTDKWNEHHRSFRHFGKSTEVELHWRLNPEVGNEPSFQELWERSMSRMVSGQRIHCLGTEDLFLFLVTHGARHVWFRLRWLIDIDRLVKNGMDWKLIFNMADRYSANAVVGQALILSGGMFDTPIDEELNFLENPNASHKMAQRAIPFIKDIVSFNALPNKLVFRYRLYLLLLRSPLERVRYALSLLYPNRRDILSLPLPKALHFMYFPLKPFLWIYRRFNR